MIICFIPASFWQRRRYPVHKLSRSQLKLQCSQLKTRSDNNRDSLTVPHLLQVLELGNHLSTMVNLEPYS